MVLARSKYPDFFPQSYEIEYNPVNRILIVDYALPPLDSLPTLKEVRYIASRDEFVEKRLTERQVKDLYDSVLYQTSLRTIHELFAADQGGLLDAVVFNGLVTSVDPAIGKETSKCILSLQASKEEFMEINLGGVEPRACFRKLKGVASSELHSMTPIAPILQLEREDRRFVQSYAVADGLDSRTNLAAMDWEDFEHLIRELFEKEFAERGGEVKVTRASRDGGVDAVVFDPDPIHGGKIVIQAKRYTNTVGVSAVRDLYGTLVNEGANKGILVSTADYGPDAYEFAKGKPITLLNGANLLHLLDKHGHKARIDLKEAREAFPE
jgi:restriction system protein